jgi:hypothetical protein
MIRRLPPGPIAVSLLEYLHQDLRSTAVLLPFPHPERPYGFRTPCLLSGPRLAQLLHRVWRVFGTGCQRPAPGPCYPP